MNSWSFTGNLGGDAESRVTPNGDPVVSFSVGVQSGFGDKAVTTWARCQMWGKRGQAVASYLVKGQLVGIVGEPTLREYEQNGAKRYSLDVRVNDLSLLGKRGDAPQQPRTQQQPQQNSGGAQGGFGDFDDSDIPFRQYAAGRAILAI